MTNYMTVNIIELVNVLTPTLNEMPTDIYLPFICMLLEEYCLQHELKVCALVDEMSELIHLVNEECGEYTA